MAATTSIEALGTRGSGRQPSREVLDDIIHRIVEVADPEQIIMFGSAARGEMGPNSDIDLLVIKSGAHQLHLAQAIYGNMIGAGAAVDIIVATPEDIERYRHAWCLIIEPALREGRVVYAAPAIPEGRPERVAEPRA